MSTAESYLGAYPRSIHLPFKDGRIDPAADGGREVMRALPPVAQVAAAPFVGLTTDGTPIPGLLALGDDGLDTATIATAARRFLDQLGPADRAAASAAIDGPEWQLWINAFLTFPEHGVLLDRLDDDLRRGALDVIAATVSAVGFHDIRAAMRLNAALGEVCPGYEDTLREYMYWFTVFGDPSPDQPWGWQLMGHHLDVNCFIVGGQMVMTPTFLGTEYEGHELFARHIASAVELMESLEPAQRDRTLLYRSMLSKDLPRHLTGEVDGRHRAGAGRDNLVLPYEGIRADALSAAQRELLVRLTHPYLDALPQGPRAARIAQVEKHLDDTSFAWIGGWGSGEPFYYKVHSPVILIEYDNHAGVFFDNPEPALFHVHTIVRTPNGGDYGKDLLSQHYRRFH